MGTNFSTYKEFIMHDDFSLFRWFDLPPYEGLFISLYFIGFITPLMMVMTLSFMVHKEWRGAYNFWRILLLRKMDDLDCFFNSPKVLYWTLGSMAVLAFCFMLGWTMSVIVSGVSALVVLFWMEVWITVYPRFRRDQIMTEDYYRRQYPQLREVTDGF